MNQTRAPPREWTSINHLYALTPVRIETTGRTAIN